MSDGREEREEREMRIEQEKPENREDRIDRDDVDEWVPERVDSSRESATEAEMLQVGEASRTADAMAERNPPGHAAG